MCSEGYSAWCVFICLSVYQFQRFTCRGTLKSRGVVGLFVCLCVQCVCGERGRKLGERKVTKHNKTRGWETFVNFTTRGSSVVKITCIVRWTRVPTSASVFCSCAALAYHIVIQQSHPYKHKSRTRMVTVVGLFVCLCVLVVGERRERGKV